MAGGSKTAVIAALIGNGLIAITKFIAASITGSSAMFSESIHSLVDVGNQSLLLFGLNRAQKPATAEHPYGFGKEIYFYSFIVAILLFSFGGGLSLLEGIKHLSNPKPIASVYINYIVLGFAFIFESAAWYVAFKEFKKTTKNFHWFYSVHRAKDPAIIVVLLEDTAAMIGLVVAAIGVTASSYFNLPIIDSIASIIIGLVLLAVAVWLAYESKSLLVGEAANPEIINQVKNIISNADEIVKSKNIMTMHMGPNSILLNLDVDFKENLGSSDVENSISRLEREIKQCLPDIKWVYISAKSFNKKEASI